MRDQLNADAVHGAAVENYTTNYRNYVLIVLTTIFTINVIDRQILSMLMQPIKLELGLSDTQLGLLTGMAFAICYATMGIPIAMWADRGNRRNIIAIALTLFSAMTVLSGLVVNYLQLLGARILIAVGEAGTTPSSHSIISDMFPPEKRGSAIGIYSLGINLGVLIGFPLGGWVAQLYGWRAAFFVVGLPGLVMAIILRLTVKEPVRGQSDGLTAQGAAKAPGFGEVARLLWSQHSFRHIITAVVITSMGSYAIINWFPAFLMRSYEMKPGEVGSMMALILGIVGGLGTFFSGFFGDRMGKRDLRWNVWVVAITNGLSFPFCIAMYLVNTKAMVLLLFIYPAFAFSTYLAPSISMTHALVSVRMRAQASAVFFFVTTFIAGSLGPLIKGMLSDHWHPIYGEESLRYALLVMTIFWIWSSLHFILAGRTLKDDIARIRAAAPAAL